MNTIIIKNKEWIDSTWEKIDNKLKKVAVRSRYKLPYTTDENGVHDNKVDDKIWWWTNGFWGGMMWLMYLETQDETYKETAKVSGNLVNRIFENYDYLDHDAGFLWHLTAGADYRITGDKKAYSANMLAAASLASRYNIDGDFIRAWNGKGNENLTIIDCLMNLALLYWASEVTGDKRFKKIAMRHADMALRDHIRPDGSINHIVNHEADKVGVKNIVAGQGYSETSCWSRGLAWAVYGSIISYIHAGKAEYLEAAKKTADYFIEHCKKTDYLPVIDFMAPETPVYYDSTAGVCAACGMLEIAKCVSKEEGKRYTEEAIHILKACDQHFCNYEEDEDALVLMGSERYPSLEEYKRGVHIPIIYGDFFFVEAMLKLKGNEFFIW